MVQKHHGMSHLCSASVGGNAAVARVLVEHGADVNRRDSEGKTVMMVRWCLLEVSLTPAVSSSHVSSGPSVPLHAVCMMCV